MSPTHRWPSWWGSAAVLCVAMVSVNACASRRLSLPGDAGRPLPEFDMIAARVSEACSGVRTLTAELGLSGRVGRQRLRGRAIVGFERPASIRLEGVAPFGPPAFILASGGPETVLLLPRDDRVLRGVPPEDVLGAITGIALAPAELQAILTGCVVPSPRALDGREHQKGWVSLDLDGGARLFVQMRNGAWQLRAARRGAWEIEYATWVGSFPSQVRLISSDPAVPVDVTAAITQLEANVEIPAAAFEIDVPSSAGPITLDELRDAGPLRGPQ